MSKTTSGGPDTGAAFTGLVLGAAFIGAILYAITMWTNKHFEAEKAEHGGAAAEATR